MRPAAAGTEYGILERSSLNACTVESTDGRLVKFINEVRLRGSGELILPPIGVVAGG